MFAILNKQNVIIDTIESVSGQPAQNVRPIEWPKPAIDPENQDLRWSPQSEWQVLDDKVVPTYQIINKSLPLEQERRLAGLKDLRNAAIDGGVEVEVSAGRLWFDSDSVARDNISQAVQDSERRPEAWPKVWRTMDNQWVPLTAADIEAVRVAVVAHVEACFERHAQLEQQIQAAQSPAELEAINLSDWPRGAL